MGFRTGIAAVGVSINRVLVRNARVERRKGWLVMGFERNTDRAEHKRRREDMTVAAGSFGW